MKILKPITQEEFVEAFDFFERSAFLYRGLFKETGSRALTEALLVAAFDEIQAGFQPGAFESMTTDDQCSFLFAFSQEFEMSNFISDQSAQSFAADPQEAIYVSVSFFDLDEVARQSITIYNLGATVEDVYAAMLSYFNLNLVDPKLVDKYIALGVEGLRSRLNTDWQHLLAPREHEEVPNDQST